jgi:hypothetical protein
MKYSGGNGSAWSGTEYDWYTCRSCSFTTATYVYVS